MNPDLIRFLEAQGIRFDKQGNPAYYDPMEGTTRRLEWNNGEDPLTRYTQNYDQFKNAKDDLGRPLYGSDIVTGLQGRFGNTPTYDPITMGVENWVRGAGIYEGNRAGHEAFRKVYDQYGVTPQDFSYDPTYGSLLRGDVAGRIAKPLAQILSPDPWYDNPMVLMGAMAGMGGLSSMASAAGYGSAAGGSMGSWGGEMYNAFNGAGSAGTGAAGAGADATWGASLRSNPIPNPLEQMSFPGGDSFSVNPLADLQGGSMDFFNSISDFNPFSSVNPLEAMNFSGEVGSFANNPLFSGFMDGAGPLAFNPLSPGAGLFGEAAAGLSGLGGLGNITDYLKKATNLLPKGGAKDGGMGDALKSLWSDVTGGATLKDTLGLAARLAPGYAALQYAQNQQGVDTEPLGSLMGQGASAFNSPLNTSRLSGLYDQVSDMTGRNTANALQNFDTRTGAARGDLLSGLQRRNVMGSSFANMDIGNFDTQSQNQRGMLEGQLGLQGLQAQTGIANSMLGAEQAQRQQQLGYLGQQGTLASQLLNSQLQQKAIQSGLYGRAFDVLGRAVAPQQNVSLFGRAS